VGGGDDDQAENKLATDGHGFAQINPSFREKAEHKEANE
jgi:hypothetical protein